MIPFPDKKYDIIYADPPWSYSDKGCNGNAADPADNPATGPEQMTLLGPGA